MSSITKETIKSANLSMHLINKDICKYLSCERGKAQKVINKIREKFNISKGTKITLYQFLDYQGLLNLLS